MRELETVVTVCSIGSPSACPRPASSRSTWKARSWASFAARGNCSNRAPILIFELTRPNWDEESRLLGDLGYTLFDRDLPPGERKPLTAPTYNILGIPS